MYTPMEFVVEMITGLFELGGIFAREVLLSGDPLTAIIWLMGATITGFSIAFFGYLVAGALGREVGIVTPTPRRARRPRE